MVDVINWHDLEPLWACEVSPLIICALYWDLLLSWLGSCILLGGYLYAGTGYQWRDHVITGHLKKQLPGLPPGGMQQAVGRAQ